MKKSIFTAAVLSVLSIATIANTSYAQGSKKKTVQQQQHHQHQNQQHKHQNHQFQQHQGRQFTQQHQYQQQIIVNPGFNQPTPKLGFQGQMLYGYGMKVVSVNWGSPAQQVGLESGDIITKINGRQIQSQWDYDQALRDAANYSGGQVNLVVKNIRYTWGWNVQEYVYSTTYLQGFGQPSGPIGPRSVPSVAAYSR